MGRDASCYGSRIYGSNKYTGGPVIAGRKQIGRFRELSTRLARIACYPGRGATNGFAAPRVPSARAIASYLATRVLRKPTSQKTSAGTFHPRLAARNRPGKMTSVIVRIAEGTRQRSPDTICLSGHRSPVQCASGVAGLMSSCAFGTQTTSRLGQSTTHLPSRALLLRPSIIVTRGWLEK